MRIFQANLLAIFLRKLGQELGCNTNKRNKEDEEEKLL